MYYAVQTLTGYSIDTKKITFKFEYVDAFKNKKARDLFVANYDKKDEAATNEAGDILEIHKWDIHPARYREAMKIIKENSFMYG